MIANKTAISDYLFIEGFGNFPRPSVTIVFVNVLNL